jgi:hypothetical protein
MNYICKISGYCPIQELNTSIDVKYIKIKVIGSTQEQYKPVLDYCDYGAHCSEKLCPIVKNCPATP